MYGILPSLHRYHRERTMNSLCLMVCTTFLRLHQVIIQLTIIEWVGSWGDICFFFFLKTLPYLYTEGKKETQHPFSFDSKDTK